MKNINKYPRYSPTNAIGINILTGFVNNIGWIPREVTSDDMGIDMYMEQVVDGNPTARYVAVQLKTGYGNISIGKRNGSFTVKNISEADRKYWDLSSCPVIVVFCDPDSSDLYWTLYRQDACRKSVVINPKNKLTKDSVFELNAIIEAYQKPFTLNELDDEDVRNDPNYWSDLLDTCKEVLANSNNVLDQFKNKYDILISSSEKFIKTSSFLTKKAASSHIRRQSHQIATAMNICRTQLKSQISIIEGTFIEAFSLFKYFSSNFSEFIPDEIKSIIKVGLTGLQEQLQSSTELFKEAEKQFSNSDSIDSELRKSEYAFSLISADYVYSLQRMGITIHSLLEVYE